MRSQVLNHLDQFRRVGGLSYQFGTTSLILQTLELAGIITTFPAIESLWGDAKVPAGQTSIVTMRTVVIKPLQSLTGFMRNITYPFTYGNATRGKSISYLHDTIISVTNLSELPHRCNKSFEFKRRSSFSSGGYPVNCEKIPNAVQFRPYSIA